MEQHTLAIIKPDAVAAGKTGQIIELIEKNGFIIDRMEKGLISKDYATVFYDMHKDKPFFAELTEFISSAPIVVMALRKENAIEDWRKLLGDTDPANAAAGTLRKLFGTSKGKNALHGSDSVESAARELFLFFGGNQAPKDGDDSCEDCCGEDCDCEGDCKDCPCKDSCKGCHKH